MTSYVYRLYTAEGVLLYIGKANNPLSRVGQHAATKEWGPSIARATVTPYADSRDALDAEAWAIAIEGPVYNVSRPQPTGPRPPMATGPFAVWEVPASHPTAAQVWVDARSAAEARFGEPSATEIALARSKKEHFARQTEHSLAAREAFAQSELDLLEFVTKRLRPGGRTPGRILWDTFKSASPAYLLSQRAFYSAIVAEGYAKRKTNIGVVFECELVDAPALDAPPTPASDARPTAAEYARRWREQHAEKRRQELADEAELVERALATALAPRVPGDTYARRTLVDAVTEALRQDGAPLPPPRVLAGHIIRLAPEFGLVERFVTVIENGVRVRTRGFVAEEVDA